MRSFITLSSKPYQEENGMQSIRTQLGRQWEYSPEFRVPIKETKIKLTGSRKRDYIFAEEKSGEIHIPKKLFGITYGRKTFVVIIQCSLLTI